MAIPKKSQVCPSLKQCYVACGVTKAVVPEAALLLESALPVTLSVLAFCSSSFHFCTSSPRSFAGKNSSRMLPAAVISRSIQKAESARTATRVNTLAETSTFSCPAAKSSMFKPRLLPRMTMACWEPLPRVRTYVSVRQAHFSFFHCEREPCCHGNRMLS